MSSNSTCAIRLLRERSTVSSVVPSNTAVLNGKIVSGEHWEELLGHYDVLCFGIEDLRKIAFVPVASKVLKFKCGHLMTFDSPIEAGGGFRIIPGFPRFSVNNVGKVKSMFSGKILSERIGPYGYPVVSILDPDKKRWRQVLVHLLLARAFVVNDDPINKIYVNHRDGDKLNLDLSNLEWVTSRENVIHAVNANLRPDNIPCEVRNVKTGAVKNYSSISEGMRDIGLKGAIKPIKRVLNGTVVPNLFLGLYEFRTDGKSDWYYTSFERISAPRIERGPFQALHVETGKEIMAKTLSSLSVLTGVTIDRIYTVMRSETPKTVGGYYFRKFMLEDWPLEFGFVAFNEAKCFRVLNQMTREFKIFKSSRQLRSFLGLDKKTLKNRIDTKQPYGNWVIEVL